MQPVPGRNFSFPIIITAVFSIVAGVGIWNHEMWRDELQAWLLVCNAPSLGAVFENCRYEGHPMLWHTIVWLAGHLWRSPYVIQVVHLLMGIANVFLLARYAPFNRFQKVLLAFGYYLLFEYTMIARCYSTGIFFLFLFCVLYRQRHQYVFWLLVIAGLLANTSASGLAVSGALVVLILAGIFYDRPQKLPVIPLFTGLAIYLSLASFSVMQVLPEADNANAVNSGLMISVYGLLLALSNIVDGYTALISLKALPNWNLMGSSGFSMAEFFIYPCIAVLFISVIAVHLYKARQVFVYFICANLLLIALSYISARFVPRHLGHYLIVFISAIWMASVCRPQQGSEGSFTGFIRNRLYPFLVYFICIAQFIPGVLLYMKDLHRPFSVNKEAADYIIANKLDRLPTLGYLDYIASPITAWTGKEIFFTQRLEYGTFIRWDGQRAGPFSSAVLDKCLEVLTEGKTYALLVLSSDINDLITDGLSEKQQTQISFIRKFEGGMAPDEKYYLYLYNPVKH